MQLHRELSKSLLEETGIDVDFRVRSSVALAFTEADVRRLQVALPWQQRQPGYAVRWLDSAEARRGEPRISDETLGATLIEGGGARKGILYRPATGHAVADLVLRRGTRVALDAFAPARFAAVRE